VAYKTALLEAAAGGGQGAGQCWEEVYIGGASSGKTIPELLGPPVGRPSQSSWGLQWEDPSQSSWDLKCWGSNQHQGHTSVSEACRNSVHMRAPAGTRSHCCERGRDLQRARSGPSRAERASKFKPRVPCQGENVDTLLTFHVHQKKPWGLRAYLNTIVHDFWGHSHVTDMSWSMLG
jgi:hypothetical protein